MSGRLVILRHKKWNVWNQDNVEKVLKDERLAREEEEEKLKNEKTRLQEKNFEVLTGKSTVVESADVAVKTHKDSEAKNVNPKDIPQKFSELAQNKPWYLEKTDKTSQHGQIDADILEEDPMKDLLGNSSGLKSNPNYKMPSIEELRAKRLQREKIERKRAVILLSERDIYGSYGSNKKRKF
jgi:hypothetical protein